MKKYEYSIYKDKTFLLKRDVYRWEVKLTYDIGWTRIVWDRPITGSAKTEELAHKEAIKTIDDLLREEKKEQPIFISKPISGGN
jgi:hypothetical protein